MSEAEAGSGPVRKFNPGLLQSDAELIEQFVARERELGLVEDVLRSNVHAPSCQHVLVVAPRGRGKTMLLARVAAEIRADAVLAAHLVPVRFMEESAEVFSLADFWMETLFHLAGEIAGQEPGLAKELSDTHAALSSRWRDETLEGRAQAAVLDAADRLERRLVLMVENVQSLVATVDEGFGWGLRATLQSVPQVMLIASATTRFEALDDPRAPFFELFRLVQLEPLDTEECRRLWTAVSGQAAHRYEIRPLEILTGGSPRLIVVVAAFARHRSLRELMEELVGLVDAHTEYFRGHLEALPRNERRVFVSLIDLWQASSTGEIAARARLDVRVVSTMLGRLVARGAVTAAAGGAGGRRLYAAAERLHSIYYKLRRERDEAAVVDALIHFMVAFYDVGELYQASDRLMQDAIGSTAIQAGIDRALARRTVPPEDLLSWIKWKEVERTSDEVVARFGESEDVDVQRSMVRSLVVKAEMARKARDWQAVARTYGEAIDRFCGSEDVVVRDNVESAWLNRGFAYGALGDFGNELACYDGLVGWLAERDALEGNWSPALVALMHKARRLAELARAEEALGAVAEASRWFERKSEECPPETRMWIGWHLGGSRSLALMGSGADAQAMDAFREAYGLFLPHSELAMGEMLRLVPELVAAGASEKELIAVLLGDERNGQALQPLVVALRTRTGEPVRAPAEVLEVAADLVVRIEERLAKGLLPASLHRKEGV